VISKICSEYSKSHKLSTTSVLTTTIQVKMGQLVFFLCLLLKRMPRTLFVLPTISVEALQKNSKHRPNPGKSPNSFILSSRSNVLGGRLSGNLCHCCQATPTVRWHWDTVNTKNKDHAGDEELRGHRSIHVEQFTRRLANQNSLPIDVRSTSEGPSVQLIDSTS